MEGYFYLFIGPVQILLHERSNQGIDEIAFWNVVELQPQKTFSEEAQVKKKKKKKNVIMLACLLYFQGFDINVT